MSGWRAGGRVDKLLISLLQGGRRGDGLHQDGEEG